LANRKLNRRQEWRAKKIQAEREQRALNKNRNLDRQVQSGQLSGAQTGLVICRYAKHFEIEALEGQDKGKIHQCVCRTNLGSVVAGDIVVWRAGSQLTGVIESRQERTNLLERPDNYGKLKPVAANIDQVLVVIACEPEPQPNLVDRYLVAAQLMDIQPIIVLNKSDLINASNKNRINALLTTYQNLAYLTVKIISSRHQAAELANLPQLIKQRTSIVVGQSGVGKSSLINTLLPDANLEVGGLSRLSREGTHTTTKAKLFHLPGGGKLIDSPGIRDFSLWHINEKQLEQGFVEISAVVGECRFRDCHHEAEPNCAVLAAVQSGQISATRWDSFIRIREAIRDQQARGLKAQ
jgi:ribosome biogenesis GTPase